MMITLDQIFSSLENGNMNYTLFIPYSMTQYFRLQQIVLQSILRYLAPTGAQVEGMGMRDLKQESSSEGVQVRELKQ